MTSDLASIINGMNMTLYALALQLEQRGALDRREFSDLLEKIATQAVEARPPAQHRLDIIQLRRLVDLLRSDPPENMPPKWRIIGS